MTERARREKLAQRALVLVETIQFSVAVPDDELELRVELFEALAQPRHYGARLWRIERFRIQSTFPQVDHHPAHRPSDESILKEFEGLDTCRVKCCHPQISQRFGLTYSRLSSAGSKSSSALPNSERAPVISRRGPHVRRSRRRAGPRRAQLASTPGRTMPTHRRGSPTIQSSTVGSVRGFSGTRVDLPSRWLTTWFHSCGRYWSYRPWRYRTWPWAALGSR